MISVMQMYRNIICNRIIKSWNQWKNKVQLYHGHAMSIEKYRNGMLNSWAHESEIEAASDIFRSHIFVYLKGYMHKQPAYTLVPYKETQSENNLNLLLENNLFKVLYKFIGTEAPVCHQS
jgi:hypothetical protein